MEKLTYESTPQNNEPGNLSEEERSELNFLERLQSAGELEGVKWDRETHWPRVQELRAKKEKSGLPTEEQMRRFHELSKLQTSGGRDWTPELAKEIMELYPLIENLRERRN